MAKKTNAERRARAEALRVERERQARRERLRSWSIFGVCGLVVVVVLGFAVTKYVGDQREKSRLSGLSLADVGVSRAQAACSAVTTKAATGNNVHIPPPTRITYPDAPPAFGRHWPNFLSGSEIKTFYSRQDVSEIERLVHSLEHGHTILWYDDTIKTGSKDYRAMQDMADKLGLDSYFMVAPYITKDDGGTFPVGKHVALTHWTGPASPPGQQKGVWQYCARPSGSVVKDFVKKYPKSDAPEPGAA